MYVYKLCSMIMIFNVLQSTIVECLNGNDDSFKARNYQSFKHFILNSNVWLIKMPNGMCKNQKKQVHKTTKSGETEESNNHNTNNTINLFDVMAGDVNKLLMKQQEYIWKNVEEIQNENSTCKKLCNFGVNNSNRKYKSKSGGSRPTELRQDGIENDIVSNVDESEMRSSAHSSFDLNFETNTYTYKIAFNTMFSICTCK